MPLESLSDFVTSYAGHGDEIAVHQRRGYRMEMWTYGRIAQEANRMARELEFRGIRKGDAVLLWGENSAEWIVAFLGCLLYGVVIVPIGASWPSGWARRSGRTG
jgi:long-chain acyl-CoA synthetase